MAEKGTYHEQVNRHGSLLSVRPTMSWQLWWHIPLSVVQHESVIAIGMRGHLAINKSAP